MNQIVSDLLELGLFEIVKNKISSVSNKMISLARFIHFILLAGLTNQEMIQKLSQMNNPKKQGVQLFTLVNEATLSALQREQLNTALSR